MGQTVGQQGMKAGIGQHDFKPTGRRRVSVEDGLEVLFNGFEHLVYMSSGHKVVKSTSHQVFKSHE